MKTAATKKFHFSASFSAQGHIVAHNYVLGVVTEALGGSDEARLEKAVERTLIHKINSRDLGLHVDFLKNVEITELNLLKVFWKILEPEIQPLILQSIFLEKDGRSQVSLSKDN